MRKHTQFDFVVLTTPNLHDPAVAIAAVRCGATGVLDLEYSCDRTSMGTAIATLAQHAKGACGIKLDADEEEFSEGLISGLPGQIGLVILTQGQRDVLRRRITDLHARGLRVWLEVSDWERGLLGQELEADGLIAKGHEAGGKVGEETSFVLLQQLKARVSLPVWVQGGIGLHTAAACYVAGARGVVLDDQVALTRESAMPAKVKAAIARMDGGETLCLGGEIGQQCRIYTRPGLPVFDDLQSIVNRLVLEKNEVDRANAWRGAIRDRVGWEGGNCVWLLGQGAAFADSLARRFRTVGGVVEGMREAVDEHVRVARKLRSLDEGSTMAQSHGTRYPIVQGPMTRVSDRAEFAAEVVKAGGLPFLALALMRASEVRILLEETLAKLGGAAWGVGILGFVPLGLRREQLQVIQACRPPFALIAGGQPEQALELEQYGIRTYLHVPSPGLLKLFVEQGARRFVFEGRECGGHVGPRSSFVLWNTMIDALLESVPEAELEDCHVLFAGGIHDALSASMVAAAAAPLASRGVRLGALLGTAYLFTVEAIASGAIVPEFQREALRCTRTVLLHTGPGHATRCAETPYVEAFEAQRELLAAEGASPEEIRTALEDFNLGRLRVASKGVRRQGAAGSVQLAPLVSLTEEDQRREGMYMIGQVAALRTSTCRMEELHREVSVGSTERLAGAAEPCLSRSFTRKRQRPCNVAIVGMACRLPKAPDLQTYCANILNAVDAITEVPGRRWDWQRYFDEDPSRQDKIYSKWGGFLDDMVFDPVAHGIPPNALPSIEPIQLLTLDVVASAIEDAGYAARPFSRSRTSVIIGVGGGSGDLGQQYAVRSSLPMLFENLPEEAWNRLPKWTEDSFPGILLNVVAGRVANRFDLGGVNYTVDAACASSLAAIYLAANELEAGTSDMVIAGGADTVQNPFAYLCFSKTHALSPRGRCRTFDETADGIVISEGVAVLVLKRLEDAERDGDRIYAVIKAVAGSSDGRAKGLTAPRPEGQVRAVERAYENAGFSPKTVGLIEAHGTGTVVGDQAEVETLKRVFGAAGAPLQNCAIGSVKSMIGHTKCTAGAAGLIKAALGLHYKFLPPTIHVEKPNSKAAFAESPFYVNTETRPWIHRAATPRRAGVSAFGFGGTNFHAVLEEYSRSCLPSGSEPMLNEFPGELLLWSNESRPALRVNVERVRRALAAGARPALRDLAWSLWQAPRVRGSTRLAVVASSLADLDQKLQHVDEALRTPEGRAYGGGVYLSDERTERGGKVAFLFPGQGSQNVGMLADLAIYFPEVRECFESADRVLAERVPEGLSWLIFPPPQFTPGGQDFVRKQLTATRIAQPALGAAGMAMFKLLGVLGIHADMVAGHSYGEYVALCAAGVIDESTLYLVSEARGRCILEAEGQQPGAMAAAGEDRERVAEILGEMEGVWIANINGPRQTVISGRKDAVDAAVARLRSDGAEAQLIPVACAFHSPLMAPARDQFARVLTQIELRSPRIPVFSNTSAQRYPHEPDAIAGLLTAHLAEPVRFRDELDAMYEAGGRIYIEAGPRDVLTSLTRQVLGSRPHLAVATDGGGRSGMLQLLDTLAQLSVYHVPIDLDRLFAGRPVRELDLNALANESRERVSPTAWLVNGGEARPYTKTGGDGVRAPISLPTAAPASTVGAAPAIPSPAAAANGDGARVMVEYQKLMGRFLEAQQQVMLAYLNDSGADADLIAPLDARALEIPAAPQQRLTEAATERPPEALMEVAAAASADSNAPTDEARIRESLLHITSERTGYPVEMLNLDVNIEAQLGIDSIKRVEIIGAFRRAVFSERAQSVPAIEDLTGIKTLRGIIERCTCPAEKAPPEAAPAPPPETPASEMAPAPRYVLEATPAPLTCIGPLDIRGSLFLITDDETGVAEALAGAIEEHGARVVIATIGSGMSRSAPGRYVAALAEMAAVEQLLENVRGEHGSLDGILHLLPLKPGKPFAELDLAGWRQRMAFDVKTLFCLARAASSDLKRSERKGRGWLLGATCMGGSFACGAKAASFYPSHGGVAGIIKALADEWPTVRAKVLDFSPELSPASIAARFVDEMAGGDSECEAGYTAGGRVLLQPVIASLAESRPLVSIGPDTVILITGGARGITAEVAKALAASYRCQLLLVGTSPLPEEHAANATSALSVPRQGIRDREIRENIAAMREAGATVRYFQADLRDEAAVESLADEVELCYGRVDGIVHGAGIVEDKRIEDKSPESFDRVIETKAVGSFLLTRRFRHYQPAFEVFFSSVSGRFGNRGQCDYAAANEILNKMAEDLDRHSEGRVVSINWGPWSSIGMVSAGIEDQFAERGVRPIVPEAGCRAFDLELRAGCKGEVEVIVGEGPWSIGARARRPTMPLIDGIAVEVSEGNGIGFTMRLDPERHLYLSDHRLDGRPVFPAAMAMELMAETAQHGWREWQVAGIRSLRILHGIVAADGRSEICVIANSRTDPSPADPSMEVAVEIREPGGRPCYRATVELARGLPAACSTNGNGAVYRSSNLDVDDVYFRWLFHGSSMRCITAIDGLDESGITGVLQPSRPSQCVGSGAAGEWLLDPVLLDGAFQLVIVWERTHHDMTPLPSRCDAYRRFGTHAKGPVRCTVKARSQAEGHSLSTTIHFADARGRVFAILENMEFACSRALNRLAAVVTGTPDQAAAGSAP